jgi:hypothetical protein
MSDRELVKAEPSATITWRSALHGRGDAKCLCIDPKKT